MCRIKLSTNSPTHTRISISRRNRLLFVFLLLYQRRTLSRAVTRFAPTASFVCVFGLYQRRTLSRAVACFAPRASLVLCFCFVSAQDFKSCRHTFRAEGVFSLVFFALYQRRTLSRAVTMFRAEGVFCLVFFALYQGTTLVVP
jgi:hypothetical protein